MSVRFLSGVNVDQNTLFVDDVNNRVGIGTSTPGYTLDISGNLRSTGHIRIEDTGDHLEFTNGNVGIQRTSNFLKLGGYDGIIFTSSQTGIDSQSERMRITVDGNVGIGTTSPFRKLVVDNSNSGSTGGYVRVQNEVGGAGANVGIDFATFSPQFYSAGLTSLDPTAQIQATDVSAYSGRLDIRVRTSGTAGVLATVATFDRTGNVGIGTTSPSQKLEVNGGLSYPYIRISASSQTARYMELGMDSAIQHSIGAFGSGTFLTFKTVGVDRMVLDASGNVGIGTTSPDQKLVVSGNIRIPQNNYLYFDNTAHYIRRGASDVEIQGFNGLQLRTNDSTRVYINQSGNVGIGTTVPSQKLHVVGNGLITGTLEVDTVNNGIGDFLTRTSGGIVTRRTSAEVRSDIQASQYFTVSSGSWVAASTSGWFRLASTSGSQRGSVRVILSFIGGSFAPQNYIIDVTKDWTTTASLRVDVRTAQTRWITGVRVIQDTVNTSVYHLEANFASSSNPYEFHLTFDNAYGFNSTWTMATTAPLVASTNGTVILSKDIFLSGDYSTDLINTGNINISGNTLSSINTNGNIILSPNGSGNVGIGTTAPAEKLQVNGFVRLVNAGFAGIEYHNTNGTWETYVGTETGGGGSRYNSASSQHTFYNNGSAVVRINSSGNVGIGTTAPEEKLHVEGSTFISYSGTNANYFGQGNVLGYGRIRPFNNSGLLAFDTNYTAGGGYDFAYNGSSVVRINSSGNVGIGTTSPGTNLEVTTASSSTTVYPLSLTNPVNEPGTVGGAGIRFSTSSGPGGVGNEANKYSSIEAFDVNNYGSNSGLSFTTSLGYTKTKSMVIDRNGNVGIGTTSPANKLTVSGDIGYTGVIGQGSIYGAPGNASFATMQLYNGATGFSIFNNQSYGYHFNTGGTTKVTILNNGNVGIGTTAPGAELVVNSANSNTRIFIQNAGSTKLEVGYGPTGYGFTHPTGEFIGHSDNLYFGQISSVSTNVTFTTGGNVGIGTTSPAEKLDILGSGAQFLRIANVGTYLMRFGIDASNNGYIGSSNATPIGFHTNSVNRLFITTDGNVGIGTTSPAEKLHVEGTTDVNILVRTSGASGNAYTTYENSGDNTFAWAIGRHNAGGFYFNSSTGGTYPSGTTTTRMVIDTSGNVGIGTTSPYSGTNVTALDINATAYPVLALSIGGTYAGSLVGYSNSVSLFAKTGNFITLNPNDTEAVRITSAGNVGIGTTSPANTLDIAAAQATLRLQSTTGTNTVFARLENTSGTFYIGRDNSAGSSFGFANAAILYETGANPMVFVTNSAERMRITSAGNVGIGTTSPATALQVNGTARATRLNSTGGVVDFDAETGNNFIQIASNIVSIANGGNVSMTITAAGNVGIGTTSPSHKLDVIGSIRIASGAALVGGGASGGDAQLIYWNGSTAYYGRSSLGGAISSHEFRTEGTTRLTVASSGNVGIGTTSPATKLHIEDATAFITVRGNDASYSNAAIQLISGNATNNRALGIFHYVENSDVEWFAGLPYSGNDAYVINRNTGYTVPSSQSTPPGIGSSSGRLFTINSSGNVGIGTTSPSYKLDVAGDIRTSGTGGLYIDASTVFGDNSGGGLSILNLGSTRALRILASTGNGWGNIVLNSYGGFVGIGNTEPTQVLHVTGNVRVTGAYYDSSNSAGSSGQVLSSTGSGTAWVNQGEATATSLFDLLPAARTTYAWSVQLTAGTWADIFSSNTVLSNGTWMVQVFVDDWAVGGQQYSETYSGIMSWGEASSTNQGGAAAISEIVLHRSGHAANSGNFYLRTVERISSTLLFQGMSNQTYSAASTINFKFVKIF